MWYVILRELGVASILDVRKLLLENASTTNTNSDDTDNEPTIISRSYALGILPNSYASLLALHLNDSTSSNSDKSGCVTMQCNHNQHNTPTPLPIITYNSWSTTH